MSYDFCIEQIAVPSGAKFPLDMETWGGNDPHSKVIDIEDPETFWNRLSAFPEMIRNGPQELRSWIFNGIMCPGSGFMVDPVHNYTADAVKEVCTRLKGLWDEGLPAEECLCRLQKMNQGYGLTGIRLDMTGSWYDVLELFKYMKAWFPLLVILDLQTGSIHDEASFLKFIESRAR